MRIPVLDFEMALAGHVKALDSGDIELLPCSLTAIIARREHFEFDGFYICLSYDGSPDALLCAYTLFAEEHYVIYDAVLADGEFEMLSAL